MENCKVCNSPLKQIPAGTSKATGKPYNAFTACPNRCQQPKAWDNTAPEMGARTAAPTPPPAPTPPIQTKDNDIRANVALKMVSEIISAGKIELPQWEEYANLFYYYKPEIQPPTEPVIDAPPF